MEIDRFHLFLNTNEEEIKMKQLKTAAFVAVLLGAGAAWAGGDGHGHHGAGAAANATAQTVSSDATMTDGEVRKVNKGVQKVTLKHSEIKNLGMPPMTMVFRVKDASLLDKVQAGDKVRFAAEKGDGGFVVTRLEPAK